MTEKCCRSSPRCAGCPVRALAAARNRRQSTQTAALVTEVLGGRSTRPLPPSVAAALEQLRRASSPDIDRRPTRTADTAT